MTGGELWFRLDGLARERTARIVGPDEKRRICRWVYLKGPDPLQNMQPGSGVILEHSIGWSIGCLDGGTIVE